MSAILQDIPSFFCLFCSLFCFSFKSIKSSSTRTNPDKSPKAWPCKACHNYPVNRKQAPQHQREWQSQQHRLKWYFKKQHKIITLLLFKCLDIIITLKQIRTIAFFKRHRKSTVSLLSVLFWLEISRFIKQEENIFSQDIKKKYKYKW